MILWIQEEDHCYPISLKESTQLVYLKDFTITVIQQKDHILLRVPRDLEIERNLLRHEEMTSVIKDDVVVCKLLFLNDEQCTVYHKYSCCGTITIGSSIDNDISIQSCLIPSHLSSIDFQSKKIITTNQQDFYSLNRTFLKKNNIFSFLDILQIDQLRIILLDDGIMMNTPDNVEIHLKEYLHIPISSDFSMHRIKRIYHRVPRLNDVLDFQETWNEVKSISYHHRSLFLEIGPSLLMSSASLVTGILSAYQSYLSGRELISILPVLILPSVMLVSTLLFQPLTRLNEKHQQKKIIKQNENNHEQWILSFCGYVNDFQESYLSYIQRYYPNMVELIELVENEDQIYVHSKDTIQLRFFDTTQVLKLNMNEELKQYYEDRLLPKIFDLRQVRHVYLNECEEGYQWMKYIILQIVCFTDISIVLLVRKDLLENNLWMRSIPNLVDQNKRNIYTSESELLDDMKDGRKNERIILSFGISIDMEDEIYIVMNDEMVENDADIQIDFTRHTYFDGQTFQENKFQCELCDREIEPCLQKLYQPKRELQRKWNDFYSVHQINQLTNWNLEEKWKSSNINTSLRAMIGIDKSGKQIILDFNETKDGPHGLIAGMTGSGKSELIISMLLSIAIQYSYEDVQFALIDFKGGGAANILKKLPHVSGVLSNLDMENMERALVSFRNACIYRQKMISKMNEVSDVYINDLYSYRKQRFNHPNLEKIPDLIIVVDEFAELKRARPEFMDELISIARIGRSLGIHLVLCTQKPNGVISEEIWANCSFQIAMKMASQNELEEVIRCKTNILLREPGDFIIHSQNRIQYGKGTYTNIGHQKTTIELLDPNGNVLLDDRKEGNTQLHMILSLFQRYHSVHIPPLWLQPIEKLEWGENSKRFSIGKIDDHYHRRYLDLFIHLRNNTAILCPDIESRKRFCWTLLMTFIRSFDHEYLFVVDDLNIFNKEQYSHFDKWIMLSSSQDEMVKDSFRYIKEHHENEYVLLITDLSRFYESNEEHILLLRDLLEHSSYYNLTIILFLSSVTTLMYRDQAFFHHRYVYDVDQQQQIQQFLESSEKCLCNGKGLVKKEHLLRFTLYETCLRQINQVLDHYSKKYGVQKKIMIPTMPSIICRNEYKGIEIPIGISYMNYTWKTIRPTESIYVVSMYKEEWISYKRIMEVYGKCTTRGDLDEEDGQLIFLSLDEYRKKHQEYPVMYIGTSFRQQYYFHSKKEIKNDSQGILFYEYESELIKIL